MAFGDVFAGYEEAAGKHYQNLLQQDYENKRSIAERYAKIADDPTYDERTRGEAQKRSIHTLTFQPLEKLPKEYENFTMQLKPPTPPPVNIPGGSPQAQNMPIAQQLSGAGSPTPPGLDQIRGGYVPPVGSVGGVPMPTETPGGAAPQTPPNTGPTAGGTPQAPIQPPTPAESTQNMQPMPFNQQMERLHATTVASTKFPPMKVSSVKSMDEDGKVYDYATYAGVNPSTGEYGTWSIKSDQPVAYAPRAAVGASLNSEDEAKLRQAGLKSVLNNPTPEEIQHVNQVLPGARLVPTGYGSFYIASQTYRPEAYGGMINAVPTAPPTGQPGAGAVPLGQANPTLPKTTTYPQLRGLDPTTGKIFVADAQRTTTTQIPGALQAPQPPSPAAPGEPSFAPGPITPEAMALLQAKNPTVDPKVIRQALLNSGWTEPGQQGSAAPQAPTPPPGQPQGQGGAGVNPQLFNTEQQRMIAIRPATTAIVGNPDNPYYQSMESFGPLMDSARSRERVGTMMRVITEGLADAEKTGGPNAAFTLLGMAVHPGGISKLITNFLGLPALQAKGEVTAMEEALRGSSQQEKDMVTNLIAGYASIVGYRALTKGSAYKFSTDIMEKELPIPGVSNVNNSRDYYNKLGTLLEEPAVDIKNMKTISPEEKDFYRTSAMRLSIKGTADKTATDPKTGTKYYLVKGKWIDENGQAQ